MSNTSFENINFLEELNGKTVRWHDNLVPNIYGTPFSVSGAEFTKTYIAKCDFKRVLQIIEDEVLIVLPQTDQGGSVEGYILLDVHGKPLLQFGESNLPEAYSLPKLFDQLCCSEQNKLLLAEFLSEEKIASLLKKEFA